MRRSVLVLTVVGALGLVLVALSAAPTAGATCGATVDAASPAPASDAETALRNALGAASASGCSDWRVDLIGTFPLTRSLEWTQPFPLHLVGPAGTTATLSGLGIDHRLLTVTSAATVKLERLVLTGGDVDQVVAAPAHEGGAVLAEDLVLIDVELRGNAARVGGAVSTFDLTATRVSFVANSADLGTVEGGTVYALGEVTLTNVTFTGNTAEAGGALLIDATVDPPAALTATNVTFRGNASDDPAFGADLHLITGNPDDLPVTLRGVLFAGTGAGSGPACDFPLVTPTITAETSVTAGPVPTAVRAGGGGCADGCPPPCAAISRREAVPARSR